MSGGEAASSGAGMVDATARRTWDKNYYAKRARERLEEEERQLDPSSKEAPKMRPNLQARQEKVELDKTLGKSRVVESLSAKGAGYYCEVCDCVLKDSIGYLDHINGRRHQKNLGFSMRVDKSSVDEVKDKLAELKRKKEEQKASSGVDYDLEQRMASIEEEELARKRERRERKKEKQRKEKAEKAEEAALKGTEVGDGIDPDMAAIMGFSGFASGK